MERVLVLGGCGAGKSTFAQRLGALLGTPVVHFDQQYFLPNWVEPEGNRWHEKIDEVLATDRWVIDGNYVPTLAQRLARADTVILLDLPTWICLARIFYRIASTYGRVRFDMASGCPERLDFEFIRYAATFRKRQRPRLLAGLQSFGGQVVPLRSPSEVEAFLLRVLR